MTIFPGSRGRALCFLAILGVILLFPALLEAAEPVWGGAGALPQVALTFDDGPSPRYTPKILRLLKRHGAHATFFVLGCRVEQYPRIARALVRAGQELANHSFSHPRLTKTDQDTWERELERTALDLDLLGCPPEGRLFRPPYSAYDGRLKDYVDHTHRRLVLWSIDSGDWRGLSADAIVKNVLDRVRPGAIIIFHDGDEQGTADRSPTVAALEVILPALKQAGYRLVTISQMLATTP
jgi:peptidoglycan/xylan/chitin deacetylase (PgdA/CDA1 family)